VAFLLANFCALINLFLEFLNFLNNVDERLVVGTIEVQWPLGALLFLPLVRISEYEGLLKVLNLFYLPCIKKTVS
jgi:hypothetical protein